VSCGHLTPADLQPQHLQAAISSWQRYSQHSRSTYSKILRRFVAALERLGAEPGLSASVRKVPKPAPRAVIATDQERQKLLAAAPPHLRFFLLLCADLGLRHRTASSIALRNYNPQLRCLHFTTKGGVQQHLPITPAIADVIAGLPKDADPTQPIISLLRPPRPGTPLGRRPRLTKQWAKLKQRAGVRPDLRIHDLRRTVAEDIWEATHDLRAVQAQLGHRSPTTTAQYLANRVTLADLQPVLERMQALRARRYDA
jgi:integrase